jgi:flagellar basal body-associated protein FliL
MSNFLGYLRAVLWAFIGLGGRRSDAESRVGKAGALPMIVIALVLVVLLVAGLIGVAHFVATSAD